MVVVGISVNPELPNDITPAVFENEASMHDGFYLLSRCVGLISPNIASKIIMESLHTPVSDNH